MTAGRSRVVAFLREALITIAGLAALISPVALWMAWSLQVFMAVLAVGCAAILLAYLLILWAPDDWF